MAEEELAEWYRETTGVEHRFLVEHLTNGLPTEAELRTLTESLGLSAELEFHGDFRVANEAFRLGVRARHERRPAVGFHYLAVRVKLRRPDTDLKRTPQPWTNRVFVVVRIS